MSKAVYTITIDARQAETHRVQVTLNPKLGPLPNTLRFPVWTPGSYMIREYSRHVTNVTNSRKLDKNSWQVIDPEKPVQYEVYCFERTVRTSYLDRNVACFVGATILPVLGIDYEVDLLLPRDWTTLATSLATKKLGPGHWQFKVKDDDEWIDSPIVGAAPGFGGSCTFSVRKIPHRLTWVGNKPLLEIKKIVSDIEKVCLANQKMFGGTPFRSYEILLDFFPKAYGGLEHRSSQLSHFDPLELSDPKRYEQFLGLISHEYFHAWNVKSLRPETLGPFDYFRENYTEDLWFAEGLTAYFDDYLLAEAKLISPESYKQCRLKDVNTLRDGNPGHFRRAVIDASFDAWIRYYRQDEDSVNSDLSYYLKGAMVAWCWDAYLRRRTRGRWTLAKLMRAFWQEFGIDADISLAEARPGYSRAELFAYAVEKTGLDHQCVEEWVSQKKPAPWKDAAKFFDYALSTRVSSYSAHLLGMTVADRESRVVVNQVFNGGSAEKAGLQVQDEIVGINYFRTSSSESFQKLLEHLQTERKLEFCFSRAGKLYSTQVLIRKHASLGVDYELAPAALGAK